MTAPALHPTFATLLASASQPLTHRGWTLAFEPLEPCCRAYEWSATHPVFDGPSGDDRIVHGPTRESVIAAVDAWIAEEVEL